MPDRNPDPSTPAFNPLNTGRRVGRGMPAPVMIDTSTPLDVNIVNTADNQALIVAAIGAQQAAITQSLQDICDKLDAGITVKAEQEGTWSVSIDAAQVQSIIDAIEADVNLSADTISDLVSALEASTGLNVTVDGGNITVDGAVDINDFQDLLDAVNAITTALDDGIDINDLPDVDLTSATITALSSAIADAVELKELNVNIAGQDAPLNVTLTQDPLAVTVDFTTMIAENQKRVERDYGPRTDRCIVDAAGVEVPNTGVFWEVRTDFFGNDVPPKREVYSELVAGEWVAYTLGAGETVAKCKSDATIVDLVKTHSRTSGNNTYAQPYRSITVTALSADVTIDGQAMPEGMTVSVDSNENERHITDTVVTGSDYFVTEVK